MKKIALPKPKTMDDPSPILKKALRDVGYSIALDHLLATWLDEHGFALVQTHVIDRSR